MKNKSLILSLMGLCAAMSAGADVLTPEQAMQRALAEEPSAMRMAPARKSAAAVVTVNDANALPALYVMENSMILSADSEATTLIGYADTAFDPSASAMPPAMQMMLDCYAAEISQLRAGRTVKVAARAGDLTPVTPICKTTWNQDDPYNALCPELNGRRCMTGCTATAFAQVLRSYAHPAAISGDISFQWKKSDTETETLTMKAEEGVFDWDNMANSYVSGQEAPAVATLMKAVGYASSMNYRPEASAGMAIGVMSHMISHMDYDRTMRLESRSWYTLSDWEAMIHGELIQGKPVYYEGFAPHGGHAFVVDGYSGNGFFHVNWGWGGRSDGYFKLSALTPSSQGIGGFEGGYNNNQSALIDVRVGLATPAEEIAPLVSAQDNFLVADGSLGATLAVTGALRNDGVMQCPKIAYALKLTHKTTGEVTYSTPTGNQFGPFGYFQGRRQGWTVILPESLANDGTPEEYDVRPAFYVPDRQKYYDARLAPSDIMTLTVTGFQATFTKGTATITASAPELLTPVHIHSAFKAGCTVTNTSSYPFAGKVKLAILDNSGNVLGMFDGPTVDLGARESATVYVEDVFSLKSLSPGAYRMAICDAAGQIISEQADMTVNEFVMAGKLTCTDIRCVSAEVSNVQFELDLKCIEGYFASTISLTLAGVGGENIFKSELISMQNGTTATVTISGSMGMGTPGQTYTVTGKQYYTDWVADIALEGADTSITLEADPVPPVVFSLECLDLTCLSDVKGRLEFQATIRCTGGDYDGPVMLTVNDADGKPEETFECDRISMTDGQTLTITLKPGMNYGVPSLTYGAVVGFNHPDSGELTDMAGKNNVAFVMTDDSSAITGVTADGGNGATVFYDLQGRRVSRMIPGRVYIMRNAAGTTAKVKY